MKIGIQLSSFKPLMTTYEGLCHTLDRLQAMGCDTIQTQWIHPDISPADGARAMKERGIVSVSVQDFFVSVRQQESYYTTLNAQTGGTYLCVSRIPEEWKNPEGLENYVQQLQALSCRLTALGQKLCLHPVCSDFSPIEGDDPVEMILKKIPELELCLDLYHLDKAGNGILKTLEQYQGRVAMVHFKDSVYLPSGEEILVPVGKGHISWDGVVETCEKIGVKYAFVEQERWQGDAFDALEESYRWLQKEISR